MKLTLVTPRMLDRWHRKDRVRTCPHCSRQVLAGQWVVQHTFLSRAFADATVMQHVACLRALIAGCPEDDVIPTDPDAALAKVTREAEALAALQRVTAA